MKFVLLQHELIKGEIASIHRANCKDVDREAAEHGSQIHEYDVATPEEVRDDWLDEDMRELGYGNADVKIHKCTKTGGLRR